MREIVIGMCVDWGVSIRKACGAICFDTSSYHYKSRGTDQADGGDKLQLEPGPAEMMRQRSVMIAGRIEPDPYRLVVARKRPTAA